ncbi:helix-turn-helix transcriptional regulator [Rhodococcus sp. CSLK01-03]|uniref:Helix-turn-helix transcriptional regulator n=1 Tax=Rhodococcus indonesiensis TaxID=3055869 RepID=A0ABT7RM27_9NOCA|nr:helix-turn-helix transcriptional regulator [Rhodococcus indonesiensis]MDM7488692.1 helix-turn-helix transcriptional regulator [Rhodococcus indonesiensis]
MSIEFVIRLTDEDARMIEELSEGTNAADVIRDAVMQALTRKHAERRVHEEVPAAASKDAEKVALHEESQAWMSATASESRQTQPVEVGPTAFLEWAKFRVHPIGHISHEKFAVMAGIPARNLFRMERMQTPPSFAMVRRICDNLQLPILPALVKAGLVPASEAPANLFERDLHTFELEELIDELQRRITIADNTI